MPHLASLLVAGRPDIRSLVPHDVHWLLLAGRQVGKWRWAALASGALVIKIVLFLLGLIRFSCESEE